MSKKSGDTIVNCTGDLSDCLNNLEDFTVLKKFSIRYAVTTEKKVNKPFTVFVQSDF